MALAITLHLGALGALGWLVARRATIDPLDAGLASFGAVLSVLACLALRAQLKRYRNARSAAIVGVIEQCAVDRRAARCGPQTDPDVQPLTSAVDLLLDRIAHVESTSRAVVNSARDAIVTINHRGIVQTFNPAAEQMFGYPAAAIIGHNVARLMPEVHARRHDDYIGRYLETGVAKVLSFAREEVALRADGSTFPISLYVNRIDPGGGPPMFCGVVRDITEQQQTEREVLLHAMQIEQTNVELAQAKFEAEDARTQAEAANRSKSEFLANMSHEIRTPMTAILGFTENLLGEQLPEEDRRQALETIRRNGEHLMSLINDILDLSKIEAGRLTVERIAFGPVDIVAEVASLMRVRADAKQLELRIDYQCPLPTSIHSDPTRLRQVLINLCGNAIKFTERGAVTMRLALVAGPRNAPLLQFAISDTGIGLTSEQTQRLFRPFEQADSSTTRRFGGSGLGLNISKRLVEKLGGTIEVRSEPGKGSTFAFTIDPGSLEGVPMLENMSEALRSRPRGAEPAPAAAPTRLRGRILLAEDGPDNQRLIRFLLEKAGAEVAVVGDGKAAVISALSAASAGSPFDVVLMDMQMPILDGYRATAELRQRGYELPIVALTANAMAGDRERCIEAGCTDFAAKPVDRKALLTTIANLIPDATATIADGDGASTAVADSDRRPTADAASSVPTRAAASAPTPVAAPQTAVTPDAATPDAATPAAATPAAPAGASTAPATPPSPAPARTDGARATPARKPATTGPAAPKSPSSDAAPARTAGTPGANPAPSTTTPRLPPPPPGRQPPMPPRPGRA